MKGIQSNGFLPIIAQAIAEMEEIHGEFSSIDEINLAELGPSDRALKIQTATAKSKWLL